MTTDIIDLDEERRKREGDSLDAFARRAIRFIYAPERMDNLEEPLGLASGKTAPNGSFVHENEADEDDGDEHENR